MGEYQPSQEILEKYANLLVNFALNDYKGVQPGEVVLLHIPETAKPLLIELRKAVLKAGAHPIIQYLPENIASDFFEHAQEEHLTFFPSKYLRGLVDEIDHSIHIIADEDPLELKDADPKKIMTRGKSFKPYSDWRREKENSGKFTWTLAAYATDGMAKEAGMRLEEYWKEIIHACYLDCDDPVAKWKEIIKEIERVKDKLNSMEIEKLRVEAPGTDLIIGIGNNRKWLGGRGCNIPSYEIFTGPDWRKTEGYIKFTEPLYRYGSLIKDVYLEFKEGKVVNFSASHGENVLKAMIETENADKIGEYSLTDSRLSRITKFMAQTLFDENVGGVNGNTHLALGSSYHDSYTGDPSSVSKEEWAKMGFNDSSVHTDIVATSPRVVTATLEDGSEVVIYKDGKFTV